MGNASAKLRRNLQRGEEYACLELCEKHAEFRRVLDPNVSYGEAHAHNTPLHYAAKHSMRALVRLFLTELNGNPNKRNGDEQTALHLCCQGGSRMSRHLDDKIRSDCLRMLVGWRSAASDERVLLDAVDNKNNTALHYAASSGLMKCVELLVAAGADMSVHNEHKDTPCDAAERAGNTSIAEYLEMRTVFTISPEPIDDDINNADGETATAKEAFTGLREQELIEAKDLLLVETSDMLQVPLFTAEALLSYHDWSREQLWLSWHLDAEACCERSGVLAPASARECNNKIHRITRESSSLNAVPSTSETQIPLTCGICLETMADSNEMMLNSECEHAFCCQCWKEYVTLKIHSGQAHHITCAAHGCGRLLPATLVQAVVEPQLARKFISAEIQAFVDGNPNLKWCPHAGCSNAVQLQQPRQTAMYLRAFPNTQPPPPTSRTVQCPAKHCFCWDCLGDGHEPTSCEKWRQWHEKIAAVKPEELRDAAAGSEAAANCLWLVTHSKPCPKCQSPIQKHEGCNHIKCTKCKHDFCWVCLGHWKKHGVETGGYFRCNRYDETRKVDEKTEAAIVEAKQQTRRIQEMNKFVHYYSRYKNHLNSYEMEQSLRGKIADKMSTFSKLARTQSLAGPGRMKDNPRTSSKSVAKNHEFSVVVEALEELLRSRKVLSSSYAYGYFLKDCGYNKTVFEHMQNELETAVEWLSSLVGGTYVRGSCNTIQRAMLKVHNRRHQFTHCINSALVPPATAGRATIMFETGCWPGSPLSMTSAGQAVADRPASTASASSANLMAFVDWPIRHTMSNSNLPYSRQQYNLDLMIAIQLSRLQMLKDLKLLYAGSEADEAGTSAAVASCQTPPSAPDSLSYQTEVANLACQQAQLADLEFEQSVQMAIERSLQLSTAVTHSESDLLKTTADFKQPPGNDEVDDDDDDDDKSDSVFDHNDQNQNV